MQLQDAGLIGEYGPKRLLRRRRDCRKVPTARDVQCDGMEDSMQSPRICPGPARPLNGAIGFPANTKTWPPRSSSIIARWKILLKTWPRGAPTVQSVVTRAGVSLPAFQTLRGDSLWAKGPMIPDRIPLSGPGVETIECTSEGGLMVWMSRNAEATPLSERHISAGGKSADIPFSCLSTRPER